MSRSNKLTEALAELKRTIKERDATIKSLQREIKSLNAELNPPAKKESKKKTEAEIVDDKTVCPACYKKTLKTVELGVRTMISCSTCDHRIVVKRGT